MDIHPSRRRFLATFGAGLSGLLAGPELAFARLQSQAIALGGEVNYLTAVEGAKADTINLQVIDRVWNLWKMRVGGAPPK